MIELFEIYETFNEIITWKIEYQTDDAKPEPTINVNRNNRGFKK